MINLFTNLRIFYYTFFEELAVDFVSVCLAGGFLYYVVIFGNWTAGIVFIKIYVVILYEVILWRLPVFYTIDIAYKYFFQKIVLWCEAQDEILKAWRW